MENEKKKCRFNFRDFLLILNTVLLGGIIVWLVLLQIDMNFIMSKAKPKLPEPEKITVNLQELTKDKAVLGNPDAKVTIVLFNSFTCGYCYKIRPVLMELMKKFSGDVKLVHRNYIRTEDDYKFSQAGACGSDQGKFWEMYHSLFENGQKYNMDLNKIAEGAGLNLPEFKKCLASKKDYKKFDAETEYNASLGINGTPTLIINDRLIPGAYPYDFLKEVIEKQLKK